MPFTIDGQWVSSAKEQAPRGQRPVKIRKEKRGNAVVTVILNLPCETADLKKLAARLKKYCGCGGTVKKGIIELQGDNVEAARRRLQEEGIKSQ